MKIIGMAMMIMGGVLFLGGALFVLLSRVTSRGRLPGDIYIKGRNFTFSFPLVTCIVVSIVLTLVLNLILRFFNR